MLYNRRKKLNEQETRKLDNSESKPAQTHLKPGDLLNKRYQIQEIIGIGGMGTVYRSRDTNFNAIRLVAIKEMISQMADPVVMKNIEAIYERESNILATLRHQSIPRIYDYFTINHRSYLVMEFINGRDLDSILDEAQSFFTEQQIITWAIELCDVLSYLHSQKPEPIIFRDMKPSNIMINQQNHPMLVDFGIAKIFETGQKNTMVGTEGYSPPDQYRGEATPQVDIYALGATLHHIITLKDPRHEAPFSFNERKIKEINPNISEGLIAVIEKAIQYNPDDRYSSAAEMKEALIGVAQKTGTLVGSMFSTASINLRANSGVNEIWSFKCEDEVRGTPVVKDSTVYIGSYDNNLYAIDAVNGEFKWKYATKGGIPGKPSRLNNNLYFGSEDHFLHVISSRNGKSVWAYESNGPVRSSPQIAQGHVFFGSDDHYLHAVNSSTGKAAWKYDAQAMIRSKPFVSDSHVYFGTESGELICVNFAGDASWRFQAKKAIRSSPIIHEDVLYFTSVDGHLYALNANTGWSLWRVRLGKGSVSSPVIVDNLIYTGAADHVIYCFDLKTAKEQWRYTTNHQVAGSPIAHKDNIYCGSVDGNLYCLDQKSGQLKWKFASKGPITGAPAAADEMLYFGSADKHIYALLA